MEDRPSYYAIIPASVRYDERLKPIERLLYGEITCLTNKDGYCFATSKYFAELYGMQRESISRCISNLERCGYIRVEIEDNYIRKIYLADGVTKKSQGVTKKSHPCDQKITPGCDQKVTHNNTSSNNKNNMEERNTSESALKIAKEWEKRFGYVNSYKLQQIQDLIEDYGEDIVLYAVRQSFQAGTTSWNYVRTVAMNRKRQEDNQGSGTQKTKKNDAKSGFQEALKLLDITEEGA